jgi:palmitoyltransferase
MSDPEKLCQIIQKGNFKRILKYLETRKIKIQDFKDKKGNSILHLATLNGNLNLIRNLKDQVRFIKISFDFKETSASVLDFWANLQNNEGFLAIHYAAYRGYYVKII